MVISLSFFEQIKIYTDYFFCTVPLTANTSYHTDRDKTMTKQLFIPKKFFENIFK